MAKIRIVGDSSGYVELAAPNAAGNNTLELPSNATKLVGADASNSLNVTGIATFSGGIVGNVTGNVNATGLSTFSGGIVVSAGTTSAPSISPSGDSNTGIFFPSADTVCIGEGGTEVLRVDSNGRLGIGTINPSSTVDILGLQANSGSTSALTPTGTLRLAFDGGNALGDYGPSLVFSQRWWSNSTTQIATGQITGVKTLADGNFGGGLAFFTSNGSGNNLLERLRIDSSGRATIPYQPAFSASGASTNVNYSGGSIFQFNVADLNVGNHFDTSSYRFTCPVSGVYLFGAAIYVNGNLSACFTVNGTQVYGGADPQPLLYTTAAGITISGQIQLSLAAGDIVDFRSRDGSASNTIYMGHSNFWGRLLG